MQQNSAAEGIEPNPGPLWQELIRACVQRWDDDFANIEHYLSDARKLCAVPPSKTASVIYFVDNYNTIASQLKFDIEFKGALLEEIMNLDWNLSAQFSRNWSASMKKDITRYSPLTRSSQFTVINREEALQKIVEHINTRQTRRANTSQNNNPLIASQSAPGGGKTTFLNYLAEHISQNSELAFIPVLVTFNSGLDVAKEDKELQTAGLILRMICSFYFEEPAKAWSELKSDKSFLKTIQSMSLEDTINLMLSTIKKDAPKKIGILLCVDELLKSLCSAEIVQKLGICLKSFSSNEFNAFVTCLEPSVLNTSSGCEILYVPLEHLSNVDQVKNMTEKTYKWSRAMELCLCDCNGHPRSLEAVYTAFDTFNDIHLQEYSAIMEQAKLCYQGGASPVETELLQCALKGRPINLNETVDKLTVSNWLTSGILINTNVQHTDKTIIPQVSYFAMLLYTEKFETELSTVLSDILRLGIGWNEFEKIHLKWEQLMQIVYCKEEEQKDEEEAEEKQKRKRKN